MSLYISVFLLFLPFPSQSVISSKTGFLFVAWSHIFVGKWVCSLVQMTYQLSKYLPFTVPPAWFVTPRSSSEQIAGSHRVSYFPKFSSLPIPGRFSPKSTCTVDTTIYQTQVRMFFKAHSLKAFEQPLIFRNRSESKHLGPYSYMINTDLDGFNTLSKVMKRIFSLALGWIDVRYSTRRSTSRRCSNMLNIV